VRVSAALRALTSLSRASRSSGEMARGISTRWTVSRCFDPRGLMAGKLEQQSAQSKRRAISGVKQT
jgi:hypothetical protein